MAKKRRSVKRKFNLKLKKSAVYSITQTVFFGLAALVLISFARQGLILSKLNNFLVLNFSWATIFLPFIFLSFAFMLSKIKISLGRPNVVIGSLLFFVSLSSLGKAGLIGKASWDGISVLVTPFGTFIILIGTLITGLIILFNTSFGQVIKILKKLFEQIRFYIKGDERFPQRVGKKEMKVSGSPSYRSASSTTSKNKLKVTSDALEQKLVSNVPGEDKVWKYPPLSILNETEAGKAERGDIKGNLEVALGTKLSKITALERDLALALAAPTGTIRIEAPIPGRSLVGIELPNRSAEFVPLKKMIESDTMKENHSKLAVSLGLDVSGKAFTADIGRMPHVLIAGQTGSGKSVCINSFLGSILFRASPSEVKLILVDPKRVELTAYNGIPHLLTPVIVEPEKVISALRWLMAEMDRRYKLFAQAGARNIDSYNEMSGFQALPYIILFIDELADIMLYSPVEVEDAITRIAQMSRATGIHMVLATQRPSVDIITGLIKANIPCRIAFAVSSQVDSRVILDTQGAEKLLGKGDMLYLPPEQAKPIRIQGAFISDREISKVVNFLKNQGIKVQYTEEVTKMTKSGIAPVPGIDGDVDELFNQAVKEICQYERASASLLQRRLSIGYARAARLIDQLEAAGIVGPKDGSKPREVILQNAEEFFAVSQKTK